MRVLYYVEKELAQFDPRSPGDPSSKYENASAMSEISSLHEDHPSRGNLRDHLGRMRQQALPAIRDLDEESVVSSVSRQGPPRGYQRAGSGRQRARSMDSLDEVGWRDAPYGGGRDWERGRGRRESDSDSAGRRPEREWDRRGRERSPERRGPHQRRSRSRDDLTELGRGSDPYQRRRGRDDDPFLDEVLRRKGGIGASESGSASTARSGNRRKPRGEEEEDLPLPPPYTETESVSSSARGRNERRLRKNDAVSRESLVV